MNWEKVEKIRKKASDTINEMGEKDAYEFATDILYLLASKYGYCIWQTYTKEDVEANIGHKPTNEEMQILSDSLQCFENIRNV